MPKTFILDPVAQSSQYSHKGRVITAGEEGREVDEFLRRREMGANHSSCKATEAAFDGKKRVNHSRPFDAKLFLLTTSTILLHCLPSPLIRVEIAWLAPVQAPFHTLNFCFARIESAVWYLSSPLPLIL
jgi:hypothetical protein